MVDAFACRLNVAGDWPRYYKRGAPLATGCSGTVAPSEGESVLRVRGERCFRASLSLSAFLFVPSLPFDFSLLLSLFFPPPPRDPV